MDKKTGIMLISSLTGIVLLLLLGQMIQPPLMTISEANNQNISYFSSNIEIKVIANITSISQSNNSTTFFKLKDNSGTISGIVFEATPELLNLNQSKTYEITGKLSEYENKTEIIISKINPIIPSKKK